MIPQLLVFDLDGTLIDSRADLTAAINHMRLHYGLPELELDTVTKYIGNGVRKLVERSLQGAPVDVEEALEINKQYYTSHSTVHTELYPGVKEGLQALCVASHRLAVLTNKPGNPTREILRHFKLEPLFTEIIGGGDTEQLKPHPEGLYNCIKASEMSVDSTWMIGDHYTDLETAENAGSRSAFVRYGFGEERGFKPDAYFASFHELVRYFV